MIFDEVISRVVDNVELLKIHRLDLAVDTTEEFQELLQKNYALAEMINVEFKKNKKYFGIIDFNDLKVSNIKWSNDRTFALSVYDKEKESNGNHAYKTRNEYRCFFGNRNYYIGIEIEVINDLLNILDRVKQEVNYNKAIEKNVKKLKNFALKNNNFTSFMLNNEMYLFDDKITKELYKLKGKSEKQATDIVSFNKKKHKIKSMKYISLKQDIELQQYEINKFLNG